MGSLLDFYPRLGVSGCRQIAGAVSTGKSPAFDMRSTVSIWTKPCVCEPTLARTDAVAQVPRAISEAKKIILTLNMLSSDVSKGRPEGAPGEGRAIHPGASVGSMRANEFARRWHFPTPGKKSVLCYGTRMGVVACAMPKLQFKRTGRQQVLRQLRHRAAAGLSKLRSCRPPGKQFLFRVRDQHWRQESRVTAIADASCSASHRRTAPTDDHVLRHGGIERPRNAARSRGTG